jgi:DNA helicase-2/ATP-dependent DNA helicase PcrA
MDNERIGEYLANDKYGKEIIPFIEGQKTKIIAPAGYGKTTFIVNCLGYVQYKKLGRQLVLTHTHAGVASLKEKIKNRDVKIKSIFYNIETISGYAQKYAISFCPNKIKNIEIGNENDEYFKNIIKEATKLFSLNPIKDVIRANYTGIFVDEYQDCTDDQHCMLMKLGDILPIHILGDPMQGIFNFKENRLVDFDKDLNDFELTATLDIPYRWEKLNKNLGQHLKNIRSELEKGFNIDLSKYGYIIQNEYDIKNKLIIKDMPSIKIVKIKECEKYQHYSLYYKQICELGDESSLLIIDPVSTSVNTRKSFVEKFNNRFFVLEALDEKDFYSIAKNVDLIIQSDNWEKKFNILYKDILLKLFNKTDIDDWFNNETKKVKTKVLNNKENYEDIKTNNLELKKLVTNMQNKSNALAIFKIIKFLKNNLKFKCYRVEFLYSIGNSLRNVIYSQNNESVSDAMVEQRNYIRRTGRKIYGKCVGTTLLTKGLEFDTVAILDAHNFKDYKNFYVAITRCCRKLVIFTEKIVLDFKKNKK